MKPSLDCAGLMAPVLAAHAATEKLALDFRGLRIDLLSNSPELVKKLARYYQDFIAAGGEAHLTVQAIEQAPWELGLDFTINPPEPGKSKLKEEYLDLADGRVVRKIITGLVLVFGQGRNYAVGPCVANDNQVVNFINNRFIEQVLKQGSLLFHAAGVAHQGRGLVMAGFSGAGKSTLALQVMRKDTDFVSNDRVMVNRGPDGLIMVGTPKMPRVNPGTVLNNPDLACVMDQDERRRFSALPVDELWNLEHKYDAFIDECFGPGRFRLESPLAGLIILNWQRDGGVLRIERVELAQRRDLLPAFMKRVGLFFELDDPAAAPDPSEEAYLELLAGCPVWELSGKADFDAAADFCWRLLAEPG